VPIGILRCLTNVAKKSVSLAAMWCACCKLSNIAMVKNVRNSNTTHAFSDGCEMLLLTATILGITLLRRIHALLVSAQCCMKSHRIHSIIWQDYLANRSTWRYLYWKPRVPTVRLESNESIHKNLQFLRLWARICISHDCISHLFRCRSDRYRS
jgi:hypothetical protein